MALTAKQLKNIHTSKLLNELFTRFGVCGFVAVDAQTVQNDAKPTIYFQGPRGDVMTLAKVMHYHARDAAPTAQNRVLIDSTRDGLNNANMPHWKGMARGLLDSNGKPV